MSESKKESEPHLDKVSAGRKGAHSGNFGRAELNPQSVFVQL